MNSMGIFIFNDDSSIRILQSSLIISFQATEFLVCSNLIKSAVQKAHYVMSRANFTDIDQFFV